MHLVFAALGVIVVGSGDYVGGRASRRDTPESVVTLSFTVATFVTAVLALVFWKTPTLTDIGWGAVSGVGVTVGVYSLYRGFQRAPMGIVSPVAGVVAAAVPVAGGVATGESLSGATTGGLALAVAAIALVSAGGSTSASAGSHLSGVAHGLVTGLGFGVLLLALGLVGDDAGFLPLLAGRVVGVVFFLGQGLLTSRALFAAPGAQALSAAAGSLTAVGNLLYFLAVSVGPIVPSTAVYALFPATTVVLARVVDQERLSRTQLVGITLALAAAALLGAISVAD